MTPEQMAEEYSRKEVSGYESVRQHDVVQRAFLAGFHARDEYVGRLREALEDAKDGMETMVDDLVSCLEFEYLPTKQEVESAKFYLKEARDALKEGGGGAMKTITTENIRSWKPCYDPSRYLKEDWKGTAVDILKMDGIPFEDRLWVVLRTELVSERCMRLFAVWCARQVQHLMKNARSIAALDVAERFANGEATKEELAAAWGAARAAAWDAARAAARAAAKDAARAAAWDAARAAAWGAAWDATRAAAWDAAKDAAWAAQKTKLIEMIEKEGE